MCSPKCEVIINEVIQELVDNDCLFTAFDVSKTVQARLQKEGLPFERHRHLKSIIHQHVDVFVTSGEYVRQLNDVGAPTQAFLYFPPQADPSTYVPQDRHDTTVKQVNIQNSDLDENENKDEDEDEGDEVDTGRKPDARGTICVPNHILRAAGFSHKDIAYAVLADDELFLTRQLSTNDTKLASYTVDYSNNVRVTAKTLEKAGFLNVKSCDFNRKGDQVFISKSQF